MENDQPIESIKEKIDFFLLSAHELRTSLSAMKWLLKMLQDGDFGPLNTEQGSAIEQANGANARMIDTINDIITTIKNDSGVSYEKNPVHVAVLIAEIIKNVSSEASKKGVALTYHQPAASVIITGDNERLWIAFHNIIENAIKYSQSNTEVFVSLSSDEKNAIVQVHDHGIGVPTDKMPHLFEKFFRAGNSKETGTGLGLYSTKLILEHHSGTITMESEEGKGSTVTITLPLRG